MYIKNWLVTVDARTSFKIVYVYLTAVPRNKLNINLFHDTSVLDVKKRRLKTNNMRQKEATPQ
jgi:hypothetical protein